MSETPPHRSHRVVAGILIADGTVLLCRRSADRTWYPGVWDLPGGHVNDSETPEAALVRELEEELGITLQRPPGPATGRLQGPDFDMLLWVMASWHGTPENRSPEEHDELGWFSAEKARQLRLADPAYPGIISEVLEGGAVELPSDGPATLATWTRLA
jgi:8-oxo-dGTP diphosphatase